MRDGIVDLFAVLLLICAGCALQPRASAGENFPDAADFGVRPSYCLPLAQPKPSEQFDQPRWLDEVAAPPQESGRANAEELSKQLANPVASLISVPIQNNFDFRGGTKLDGWRYLLNIQPVIPFSLNKEWNLISRTIVPLVYQNRLFGDNDQEGLGDISESLFFAPVKPLPGGILWGVGPAVLLPTSTDDFLGAHRWGIGPTGLVLRQDGKWTYGLLANHLWSIGRDGTFQSGLALPDVNSTFLQPFLAYSLGHGTSLAVNAESTYDWISHQWTIPVYVGASQVMPIGGHPVSFAFGPRVYLEGPHGTPEWGVRFTMTLLFPK